MVDTQHFCLRWNNYQSSITSAFENLRDDEDFVDVTLACDGKSLKAHRVVLSACSPYFRELLKSTPCKHPVIVLQDVAFSDLHALVEFIYHGEVNVHQRSLSSFLKTAEVLRVSGLTQQADQTERDELADEGFPRGGSPPTPATPTPTTVQQLLRRGQIRRNEMRSPDSHEDTTKRHRGISPPLNNNDATPTDFSMVKNHLSAKVEGNGLHDDNSRIAEDNIKCEPLELTGGNGGTGPNNEDSSDSGAAASDRPPASASSNEHEHEPEHPSTPNFLPESKLFTSTPGSFNFSMAALTTDHTPLSVKFPGLGHGLQTPDLAGTSQDREVAEEDGGWRSTTSGTTCRAGNQQGETNDEDDDDDDDDDEDGDDDEDHNGEADLRAETASPPKTTATTTTTITATSTITGSTTSATSSTMPQSSQPDQPIDHMDTVTDDEGNHQDLPIIDLLEDINDHMQIDFKSEPPSPKSEIVHELESCLLGDDTADDYDPPVGTSKTGRKSPIYYRNNDYNRASSQERTFQHIIKDSGVPLVDFPSANGQNETTGHPPLTRLREIGRKPVDHEAKLSSSHRGGSGTYCSFCQKTFSRAWSLQRHLADTHFYVPQSLACDQCGRSYKSRNSLVSHKSQYHARKDRKDHEVHCEVTY